MLLHESDQWMTGKELAGLVDVSDRTIRSDIEAINSEYKDTLIDSSMRNGYKLNRSVFSSLRLNVDSMIPQTPKERCVYIIQELLFEENELNLLQLQDRVFVSGYSIDNDIKKIKKMLEPYDGLSLVRSKSYLSLRGDESVKRKLFKDLLTDETKGNFLNMNRMAELYKDFDLLLVKELLEKTLSEYNYRVREVNFPMLMMHVGVSIERMLKHNYISTDISRDSIKDSIELEISTRFFQRVKENLPIDIVEDEILLFSILLMGKKGVSYRADFAQDSHNGKSSEEILAEVFDRIESIFGIDFTEDEDLKIGLEVHIQSMIERNKNKISVSNVYLGEIKRKYPLVFEIGVQVGEVLRNLLDIEVGENEIGFLALHMGGAYERISGVAKYRAVLIFPSELALTSMCAQKIEMHFGDRLEVVECLQVFEEGEISKLKPDIILTTLPLQHDLDILTLQISIFMSNEDESKIFQSLNTLDKNSLKEEFNEKIKDFIIEEHFYIDLDLQTPEEVITFLCEQLVDEGFVGEDYLPSVLKREETSATSFVYSFAVPHSFNVPAKKTALSVALLKKPIEWGTYQVKLVVLLAVDTKDMKIVGMFFDWLGSIVNDPNRLRHILEAKNHEDFMKILLD